MPKPIVTLKRGLGDTWIISWWRFEGSSLSDNKTYQDIKAAEIAARSFAEENRMAFLPVGESFLAIEKRNNIYWLVQLEFQGKPQLLGVGNVSKQKLIEIGAGMSKEAMKIFLPDFIPN